MIYVMSDLHGCYDKFQKMLKVIHFSAEDTLYVLGDVLDRGPEGFKLLLNLAERSNVVCLMGNHELAALTAIPGLLRIMTEDTPPSAKDTAQLSDWMADGGKTSVREFLRLTPEEQRQSFDYIRSLPLYQELDVAGRKFVLVHAGLGHFSPNRPLFDYHLADLLFCRPDLDTGYYPDKYVIFGHTPTRFLNGQDKIFRQRTLIDIDCGCVFKSGYLGCLCLDTTDEFYV